MDHVAIMKKSWGLTGKIISGKKTIESRWYKLKRSPWGKIAAGDSVYFKDSGEPVRIKAKVRHIITFERIGPKKVLWILKKYGNQDGINAKDTQKFFNMFKDRKYCLLIFLKDVKKVKPFQINKKGFGAMSAWITLDDVNKIRRGQTKKPI